MESLLPYQLDLFLISTFTSLFGAVLGIGGGLMMIAILPMLVAPVAIIPLHSVTQLVSNSSRAAFGLRDVQWQYLPRFILGSALGIGLFGFFLTQIPTDYIPLLIGSYLLLNVWWKPFKEFLAHYENMFVIGFLQTGLGLVVGATGPLSLTMLMKQIVDRDKIVVTSAALMTVTHIFKMSFFGLLGFAFAEYALPAVMLAAGAVAGSWIGTKLRGKLNAQHFFFLLKVVLTVLAIRMIVAVFWGE